MAADAYTAAVVQGRLRRRTSTIQREGSMRNRILLLSALSVGIGPFVPADLEMIED